MRDIEEVIRALDERVKRLEDEQAVYRLVSSYGPAMDTGSGPECGSLWADDGVYEYDDKRAHGQADVAAMVEADYQQQLIREGCAHVMAMPLVEVDGDAATATCYSRATWNQIWRNHLLVEAIRQQPDAAADLLGFALVVHHPQDRRCIKVTNGYRELIATTDESFGVLSLAEFVGAWQPLVASTAHASWLSDFNDRYLNLDLSASSWMTHRAQKGAT